ncbi:copper homeostasis protein CutC [Rossellomorea sp. SC111]|uniref:copper homeostasis protein CutC n=1 Tax=Rossellomorea sp. SC111 TaxID=2968985 RepID=UPI00215A6ED9|nr:copper homeostasis protein CutC [Rossellomorea sp. SC111]MCR8850242.1 copper homeostasis protein CutC [Rossellomorea sp. SC111]
MSKLEVIVLNEEDARLAEASGADRLELVSAIHTGGLTPEYQVIEKILKAVSIPVQIMIRLHSSSFRYSMDEVKAMAEQVRTIEEIGGRGIVFGALTHEGKLDMNALKEIVQTADGQSITFHRAIDEALDPAVLCKEIHQSELAVERILTSGGRSVVSEGIETIKRMMEVEKAGGPIIMPGSGLTVDNINEIHSELHAGEYHVGAGVRHQGRYDMAIDPEKVAAFKKVITS